MADPRIENLMTQLHEAFGTADPSSEQQQIMRALEAHIGTGAVYDSDSPDPTPLETLEVLAEDLELEHPRAATVVRELLNTLRNMGV